MPVDVNYGWWVSRLRDVGSFHMPLDELPAELVEFRRELRRAGRAAGIRVLTSARDGIFLAWDPEHQVSDERLRAAVMAAWGSDQPTVEVVHRPSTPVVVCHSCGGVAVPRGRAWWCPRCELTLMR